MRSKQQPALITTLLPKYVTETPTKEKSRIFGPQVSLCIRWFIENIPIKLRIFLSFIQRSSTKSKIFFLNTFRPDFTQSKDMSINSMLLDLMKRMLIKDPGQRITLSEIFQHDWVTANGIQPLPMHVYPQLEILDKEESDAIKKVNVIACIRLRLKSKIDIQRIKIEQDLASKGILKNNNFNSESTPTPPYNMLP